MNAMQDKIDILIVGAGPIGAIAALLRAPLRLRPVLLENASAARLHRRSMR